MLRHFLSQFFLRFHKNMRSWVKNECCCQHTVNISNVNFTSKIFQIIMMWLVKYHNCIWLYPKFLPLFYHIFKWIFYYGCYSRLWMKYADKSCIFQIDRQKFIRCAKDVAFNQIVMNAPFSYGLTYVMMWRGCDFGPELPTFHWVVFELIVYIMMMEIGFYYSHRFVI